MEGMMKQAWLVAPGGPWEIREVPIPKPGPGQLLVKIHAGSICKQTDSNTVRALHPPHDHQCWGQLPHHLRMWDGREDPLKDVYPKKYLQYDKEPYPSRMGHEMAGEVVEVVPIHNTGEDIYGNNENNLYADPNIFKVGDRVTGSPIFGGFAEYVVVDYDAAHKIPDGVTYEQATLAEPVACVSPHVLSTVQFRDIVVVLGVGALGFASMCIAKAMGASKVVVVDKEQNKLDFALAHGADIGVNASKVENVADAIWEATDGLGADSILEVTGEPEAIQLIPYIGKMCARVACIGACCVPVLFDWSYFHFRAMSLNKFQVGGWFGSHGPALTANCHKGFELALDLIQNDIVPMGEFIDERYVLNLENLEKAFDYAMNDNTKRKMMFIFE